ncbi:hypothetical protein Y032_0460g1869 [Ancylostoma ceylanicum]|uniref:SH3 domain-containing protein n=1 Tax=Ancylostoma ceylanicum TaxID=53326 RepID=A0A016WY26_9BILA|nr:hypothetical protein Y032_0460g1869 [Ancylostoma ceylanicum]
MKLLAECLLFVDIQYYQNGRNWILIVDKLEAEDSISRDNSQLRRSFTRRCHDLYKQIDEHKKRIRDVKAKESTEEQRMTALEQLEDLQVRLLRLAPERDRGSDVASRSSEGDTPGRGGERSTRDKTPVSYEPAPPTLGAEETPVLVQTRSFSTPQPEVPTVATRRGSIMYDAASEEDEEDEKLQEEVIQEETNAELAEEEGKGRGESPAPSVSKVTQLPPQPQPRSERRATSSAPPPEEPTRPTSASEAPRPPSGAKRLVAGGNVFIVLANLQAAEQGDLGIKEGEKLTILQTRPDGWWTARNANGETGLVPKTFLRQATTADEERGAETHSQGVQQERATASRPPASAAQPPPLVAEPLRKRRVRVSKLVRLVRLEGMPKEGAVCLVRTALYDRSRKTGRQIVSNVHTIRSQVKNRTWTFNTRTDTTSSGVDYGDFIVRSNYNMDDVVLLIEASHVVQTQTGLEERSLGIMTIPLILKGEVVISNKTYSEPLRGENIFDRSTSGGELTQYRIVLKVLDVPQELVPFVDSMPDVLLFNPMFVRLYFFFRRRAGTTLLRDRDNPLSAEMISDPLLALFPSVADQPDMMDQLRNLWNAKLKTIKNKSEADQAVAFFQLFMNTAYCINKTAVMPAYCIWDAKGLAARHQVLKKCEDMLREYRTSSRFLLTEPCHPINVYDYSFDLLGRHALD